MLWSIAYNDLAPLGRRAANQKGEYWNMDEIRRVIHQARRRLVMQQLVEACTWSLMASFAVTFCAILIPKFWHIGVDGETWRNTWLIAGTVTGLLLGSMWTFFRGRNVMDAAIEIDHRCHLQERISSLVSLSNTDLQSEAGRALLEDAERHLRRVDVHEHFRNQFHWRSLLPITAAVVVFLSAFLIRDAESDSVEAAADSVEIKKQVRRSMEDLKQRLAKQQEKVAATQLPDAKKLFQDLQNAVDELSKTDVNREKALVKLNNLSKQLADRSRNLEASRKMRDQLKQLGKLEQGPADRITKALQEGDLNRAVQEMQKLQKQITDGKMTEDQKQELIKQLKQMQNKMAEKLAAKRELEKKQQRLQEEIEQRRKQGDQAGAEKLQKQLDQVQKQLNDLNGRQSDLQKLDQLAQQLGECAECMQAGDMQQASQKMAEMAGDLQQMQDELAALETLNAMMEQISGTKNAMNCSECEGEGCAACQGDKFAMAGDRPGEGDGMGEGQGYGDRPEEETDTGSYLSRVEAKPQAGQAVRVGDARGKNLAGQSQQDVRAEIASSFSDDPDPISHQQLPRREREQTREYFEKLRKGE
jgi:septal ring factor EnvC (AmiA/AmiB activator)